MISRHYCRGTGRARPRHATLTSRLAPAIGPALGGALAGLVGAPDAILGDAASFIAAGALVATVPSFDRSRAARQAERAAHPASVSRELGSGLAAAQTMAVAGYLFIAATAWSFGFSRLTREIDGPVGPREPG